MTIKTNALHVRRATEADIPAIMEIRLAVKENVLSNPARVPPSLCVEYLDALGRGWVCELDGETIGFSYAAKADSSIWALFVRPGKEGLGAGKVLLKEAVDWLFSLGNQEVHLGTQANTRADQFYRMQGWTRGDMKDAVEVAYVLRKA